MNVLLVGIGGYGNGYVSALLDAADRDAFRVVGAVDPVPSSCGRLEELQSVGCRVYPSLEAFYSEQKADLAVISTPPHLHAAQSCAALTQGSHVLCEKPMCVTPQQIRSMLEARDAAGKLVGIGYQWSFSRAMHALKADIIAGRLGRPRRLRTLVLWPRDEGYYRRNRWAGRVRDDQGNWVLDSPANNACAHYLHNMFFVLGPRTDRSASLASVTAELYRANSIENYDTAVLRCRTQDDAQVLFVTSHAVSEARGPEFHFEFEGATVDFAQHPDATITARMADGSVKDYGSPYEADDTKLWLMMDSIRTGKPPLCGIEAAATHTRCIWAAQQSREIVPFPASLVGVTGESPHRKTAVARLNEVLGECYRRWLLPTELGAAWARPGREVAVSEDGDGGA